MTKPPPNTITVTLLMDDNHDVRAVRLLLKRLLRSYHLRCVGLGIVSNETSTIVETAGKTGKKSPTVVDASEAGKCKTKFDTTGNEQEVPQ